MTPKDEKAFQQLEKETKKAIIEQYNEAGMELLKASLLTVAKKRDKDDNNNLYKKLMERIEKINVDKVKTFETIFKMYDENIEDRINIVQKFLISLSLYTYLYRLKSHIPNVFISDLITSIAYTLPDDVWLKSLTEYTIPTMVNNKLV